MAILDDLSAVSFSGAFSLSRYLRTAFTGAVVRLREDNGSTEQDFKLNGSNVLVTDDVSEDTVSTWLTNNSASNAYVVTWYNQVSGGVDFTQSTAAEQPLLLQSGINGKPCCQAGTNDNLDSASSITRNESNGFFMTCAIELDSLPNTLQGLFSSFAASIHMSAADEFATNDVRFVHQSDVGVYTWGTSTLSTATPYLPMFEFASGSDPRNVSTRMDGATEATNSQTTDVRNGTHSLFRAATSNSLLSQIPEWFWGEDVLTTSERDTLESSIATQYNITLPSGGATGKSNPLYGPLGGPLYGAIS